MRFKSLLELQSNFYSEKMKSTPSFTSKEFFETTFKEFADNLINNCSLMVNGIEANFTELEFYFFDREVHPDPFVHRHQLQNKNNAWYLHTYQNSNLIKKGTRKGIDLCLGRGNSYFGILIRGLRIGEEFIYGPSRVADRILTLCSLNSFDALDSAKKLGDAGDTNSLLFIRGIDTRNNFKLLCSYRQGLKINYRTEEFSSLHQEAFINCKYRYIAQDPNLFKGKLVGKEKVVKCSDLSDQEIKSLLGYKLSK